MLEVPSMTVALLADPELDDILTYEPLDPADIPCQRRTLHHAADTEGSVRGLRQAILVITTNSSCNSSWNSSWSSWGNL